MAKYNQQKQFNFICKLDINDVTKIITTKEGSTWRKLGLSVTDGISKQYLEISSFGKGKDFKSFQKPQNEGEKVSETMVQWNNRFDADLIKSIAEFKKMTLDIDGNKQVFLHEDDYINAIHENILNGKLLNVPLYIRGNIKFDLYDGNVNVKFIPTFISISKAETLSFKGNISLVFKRGMIEDDTKNQRLLINGWVNDYHKEQGAEKGKNVMMDQTLVFPYGTMTNGETLKDYLLSKLKVADGYHAALFGVSFFKGAEKVEVELTESQKELIEMGFMTEEEAKRDNGVRDRKRTEIRVVRPLTTEPYSKIVMKTDFTDKDFANKEEELSVDDLFGNVAEFGSDDLPF